MICSPETTSAGLSGALSIFDNTLNQSQSKQEVSLACASSGQAPQITSANNATFTPGTAGSFTVTATGTPTPALSEAGALPNGVTFVDNHNGTASLSGTPAAGTGGTYSIVVTAANGTLPNATQSFTLTVSLATQTITFSLPANVQVNTTLALTGSASSGLAVTYTSSTPAVCTVSGSTAKFLTGGMCTIVASQAGGSGYSAATPVSASTTVALASQTITISLPATVQPQTTLALTGSASSGLAVSYSSSTPAVCTVSGSTAQFLTGGTCTITASQAGNTVYAAATPVAASTKVSQTSQSITFNPLPSSALQGSSVTLTATATSGLAVSFTSLTPAVCTVSGSSATLLNAGTCTIQASQAGNATYAAATPVPESVTVTAAFTITPTPKVETIRRGNIAAFVLELQAASGFSGKVTLSCSGGPAGSYCADLPMTVSFVKGVALAISGIYFPSNTPPGTYTLKFTGTSGAIINTATAEFVVTAN